MCTNRSYIALTAGILLLAALPARAVDASDLINGKFDATSRKERREIAKDLGERVHTLAQYLPSLKPQDSAWLTQENEAIDRLGQSEAALSRRVQLGTSPEFQHEKLHNSLAAIRDAIACAGDPSTSLSREMMCWSVGSFLLTDRDMFNDSISILIKAGRLPRDVEKHAISPSLGFGYFYNLWGRGIQDYIVIPYLKGQAK